MLKLINQLLEIWRIEQSTLEVNLSDVYPADFFGEIVGMFENLSARRGITLSFINHGTDKPASIDADKVEKVLVNLLSNAFRHTPDGRGAITVSSRKVSAREKELDHSYDCYLEVSVVDNGKGISSEKIGQIFEQYYTSESTVSEHGGMGVGLSYVKDLVCLMQGEIRVTSEVGVGPSSGSICPSLPVV